MDILKNILDREIGKIEILSGMFERYTFFEQQGNYWTPQIARTLSKQFGIPLNDITVLIERYVYKELAKRFIETIKK